MDNREKINIQQMVDCEKQEPFYPVTHAQAVKIIDEGQVKNLQKFTRYSRNCFRIYKKFWKF